MEKGSPIDPRFVVIAVSVSPNANQPHFPHHPLPISRPTACCKTPKKGDQPQRSTRSCPFTLSRPLKWALAVLLAAILNLVLYRLVLVDTLGTYTITLLAGPLAGVLVVILTLSTTTLFFYPFALYHLLPHLLIVLVTWLAIRFGWTRKWWQALITAGILGLLFAVFSVLSTLLYTPNEFRTFTDFIQALLGSLGSNLPIQVVAFMLAWAFNLWLGMQLGLRKPA